ncbi:hypothetical protein [Actinomyces sp.]|uniref:hypothetical protein n=1 Tax=Actinomyces sp. TaxID=29317 RepID=UPI0026DBCE98|nr:hypothetical protein [Actinomyces sp.]MDO4901780.1 hypothetical protein [Actinomyces sp.]
MKRLPRVATTLTTTLAAVALTASLAACQSNNSTDAEERNSDQQVTAEASTGTDSGSSKTGADATSSTPTVPDGYTLTEVPNADLSFAVPSGWTTLTGAEASSQTELVDAVATATERTPAEVLAAMESLALWSIDTSATENFVENLNVELLDSAYAAPSKDEVAQFLANQTANNPNANITPDTYTKTTTASGDDAVVQSYTLTLGETSNKGAYVIVPAKGGKGFALIAISAASTERVQELADVILGSI